MEVSSLRGRSKLATPGALVASVVVHGLLIAVSAHYVSKLTAHDPVPLRYVEIALSDAVPHAGNLPIPLTTDGASETKPPEPRRFDASTGPLREARPDTRTSGHGGSREATERALHLSDSVDGLTLDADPTFFTEMSQLSRLDTASDRASREDRRATPDPMELTFVATGAGQRLARLTPATSDPAEGTRGAVPVAAGTRPAPDESPLDGPAAPATLAAGATPVDALGLDHGSRREDFRRSAAVAFARPSVKQARASVSTTEHGRPNDTLDSSQEVASAVQSLITASSAGGPLGRGPGGTDAKGNPGVGDRVGEGSRALPSGEGGAAETSSAIGIESYAAALTRKVYPYWEDALPMWARIEGRGGVAVIGVTIGESGNIRELHLVRGSGIPEFDRKVASALERASPYGRLPTAIRDRALELHIAFDAMNPAVGRAGPGPGRRR